MWMFSILALSIVSFEGVFTQLYLPNTQVVESFFPQYKLY